MNYGMADLAGQAIWGTVIIGSVIALGSTMNVCAHHRQSASGGCAD